MKQLFKVKLNDNHTANDTQVVDGYLGSTHIKQVFTYDRKDALKKAIMFGGKIEIMKPSFYIADLKIGQIDENCLIDGVVRLMGKEEFSDTNKETAEKLFRGDVFDTILETYVCSDKTLTQLKELALYCTDYDYIMVINCHVKDLVGLD